MRLRGRRSLSAVHHVLITFGIVSAALMVVSYALEDRSPIWIAVFAVACAMTAVYGVITGAWIFAVLEAVWSVVAVRRFARQQAPA